MVVFTLSEDGREQDIGYYAMLEISIATKFVEKTFNINYCTWHSRILAPGTNAVICSKGFELNRFSFYA